MVDDSGETDSVWRVGFFLRSPSVVHLGFSLLDLETEQAQPPRRLSLRCSALVQASSVVNGSLPETPPSQRADSGRLSSWSEFTMKRMKIMKQCPEPLTSIDCCSRPLALCRPALLRRRHGTARSAVATAPGEAVCNRLRSAWTGAVSNRPSRKSPAPLRRLLESTRSGMPRGRDAFAGYHVADKQTALFMIHPLGRFAP